MRLPRIRFTIRRLMIAVAAAGSIFGGASMWIRSSRFRARAVSYAERAETVIWESAITAYKPGPEGTGLVINEGFMARDAAWMRGLGEHYQDLSRKYARAARRPWLSVSPDPPEPIRPGQ